jgi:hypothetical protein
MAKYTSWDIEINHDSFRFTCGSIYIYIWPGDLKRRGRDFEVLHICDSVGGRHFKKKGNLVSSEQDFLKV